MAFLSPGVPYTDIAVVDVAGAQAALRPRDDGSFCVDIIAGNAQITDSVERDSCPTALSTTVTVEVTSNACADERTCTDVGEIDFSAFCSGS